MATRSLHRVAVSCQNRLWNMYGFKRCRAAKRYAAANCDVPQIWHVVGRGTINRDLTLKDHDPLVPEMIVNTKSPGLPPVVVLFPPLPSR